MGAKKDKKKKAPAFVFVPPPMEELPVEEEEQSEVQFTDTSYTSASFESLPPEPVHVEESKKKKKKKKELVVEEEEEVEKLFDYSAESILPEPEQEEEPPPPISPFGPEAKKKDKKGKKGKKGKKEVEEIPDFEKPKEWKKWNRKEQDKWMAERILQWKEEVEAEKQARIAGIKEKRKADAAERADKMANDIAEQEIRRDLLQKACILFERMENYKKDYAHRKQLKQEWAQYLRCDGLPDPRVIQEMATFLHRWREEGKYDEKELDRRCKECLPMLALLEEIVANSRQYTQREAANFNDIRIQLRAQLATAIECATYTLLRNLEQNMTFQSVRVCYYNRVFEGLKLNLWVAVKGPTPLPMTQSEILDQPPPAPVELEFPVISVSLTLPNVVDGSDVTVRAARSLTDFLSESSRSYALSQKLLGQYEVPRDKRVPNLPNVVDVSDVTVRAARSLTDFLSESSRSYALSQKLLGQYEYLFTFNEKELAAVLKLKKEQDAIRAAFYKQAKERMKEIQNIIKLSPYAKLEDERAEYEQLQLAEPNLPDPRSYIAEQNEKASKRYLKSCLGRLRPGEVNLRKFRVCGGVLNMDLVVTPPQPKRMEHEVYITTLETPLTLRWMPYKELYRPPPPLPATVVRTPEVIEVELARIAKEMERLALITIVLPKDVLWNEQPVLCQWHAARKLWTSNYIIDYKFIEEKLTVQFRTGVMWPIGFATLRYANLPFTGWEMKPDPKSKGVNLVVVGLTNTITFTVVQGAVKLVFISNTTTPALKDIFNKRFSVKKMVEMMRGAACDIFPDFDSHNYLEGSCPKQWQMERHLYHCMAFLGRAYSFQWSRWNVGAGYRNIVIQMREAVDTKRESKWSLLLVTPERTSVLKNDEMMPEWDAEPMVGMKFYPDLFTMNLTYGSIDARRVTFYEQFKLVETVYDLLCELKLCSHS